MSLKVKHYRQIRRHSELIQTFPILPGLIKVMDGFITRPARSGAFTLIELLVVIAIIAILAALLLPVLSRAKQRAQGALCLGRGKQMMTAMILYTGDNNDFFPPNPDDGNILPGYNWCSGNASIGGPQEFNPDVLQDSSRSLLVPFLSGSVDLFRCPADTRQGKYQGSNPAFIGHVVPAARTFSMNQAVGTIDPGFDGSEPAGGRRNSPWLTFGKSSQVRGISPSTLWVLLDEDATGLNDAAFAFGMETPQWFDLPGTYHNGACELAFADGHSETHQWFYRGKKNGFGAIITDPADIKDWQWMQQHTSAHD
jgi:prepilin-type N-terminal cleavage/methylation domain-containing protein/prepilin-type processing-associated H-X9-DG protein